MWKDFCDGGTLSDHLKDAADVSKLVASVLALDVILLILLFTFVTFCTLANGFLQLLILYRYF